MKKGICVLVLILVFLMVSLGTSKKGSVISDKSILDGNQCVNGVCLPPEEYE